MEADSSVVHLASETAPISRQLLCVFRPITEVSPFQGTQQSRCPLPLPEDLNRPSFRNAVFSGYIEFRTMDRDHKPSDSVILCYRPSTERLRFSQYSIACNPAKNETVLSHKLVMTFRRTHTLRDSGRHQADWAQRITHACFYMDTNRDRGDMGESRHTRHIERLCMDRHKCRKEN
jgi:hypothetical protein